MLPQNPGSANNPLQFIWSQQGPASAEESLHSGTLPGMVPGPSAQPSARTWGGQKWRRGAPASPRAAEGPGPESFRWGRRSQGCARTRAAAGPACALARSPPGLGREGFVGPGRGRGCAEAQPPLAVCPGENHRKVSAGPRPRGRVVPQTPTKSSCECVQVTLEILVRFQDTFWKPKLPSARAFSCLQTSVGCRDRRPAAVEYLGSRR